MPHEQIFFVDGGMGAIATVSLDCSPPNTAGGEVEQAEERADMYVGPLVSGKGTACSKAKRTCGFWFPHVVSCM